MDSTFDPIKFVEDAAARNLYEPQLIVEIVRREAKPRTDFGQLCTDLEARIADLAVAANSRPDHTKLKRGIDTMREVAELLARTVSRNRARLQQVVRSGGARHQAQPDLSANGTRPDRSRAARHKAQRGAGECPVSGCCTAPQCGTAQPATAGAAGRSRAHRASPNCSKPPRSPIRGGSCPIRSLVRMADPRADGGSDGGGGPSDG